MYKMMLNAERWPGSPLPETDGQPLADDIISAMDEYNDFILRLQAREHDRRSLPILYQSGAPETLGWLLGAAPKVPDVVAVEWLIRAMTQIASRLERRADWAFEPVANIEPQLRIVLRQLSSTTLRQMAVSFPWLTREMGGAEVLPVRSMRPEEKQRWLASLWGMLREDKKREAYFPSIRPKQCAMGNWG